MSRAVKKNSNIGEEQLRGNISSINTNKNVKVASIMKRMGETAKNRFPGIKFYSSSQEGCTHVLICTHLGK